LRSDYLTLEELLYALEHEGLDVQERTIRFWISKGILEKPLRKPFKYADGRVRYFPTRVVGEITDILKYQEEGWKLTQIKKRLREPVRANQSEALGGEQLAKLLLSDYLGNGEFRDKQRFVDAAEPSTPQWRRVRNFLVARLTHFVGRKQAVRSVTSFMVGLSKRDVAKLLRRTSGRVPSELEAAQGDSNSKTWTRSEVQAFASHLASLTEPKWTGEGDEPVLSKRLRAFLGSAREQLSAQTLGDTADSVHRELRRLHREIRDSRAFLTLPR
jgi:DNA-binding transcriptional MerR regulator